MTVLYETVRKIALDALERGGRKDGALTVDWDISGDCQAPVGRELWAHDADSHPINRNRPVDPQTGRKLRPTEDRVRTEKAPIRVTLTVRCRKCDPCRNQRRKLWASRARNEIRQSARTWFGTLTLRPNSQYIALCQARARAAKKGIDFDALSFGEQFVRRHEMISPWITKYLKRLRKNSGYKFRFMLVAEAHKSGLPHYHILIHEEVPGDELKYDLLRKQWPHGFSEFKLVKDVKTANYISKYLSKSTAARVRASVRYGRRASA